MTVKVDFEVMDVGQGSANFVLVKRDDVLITTFLIDIGSQRVRKDAGAIATAKHIVEVLNTMETPHIAALVFSHKDSDHIALLPAILDQFDTPVSNPDHHLIIDGIFYGGSADDYKKRLRTKSMITLAADYCDRSLATHIGPQHFPYNFTHFGHNNPPERFWPWPHPVTRPGHDPAVPTPRGADPARADRGDLGVTLSVVGVNADSRRGVGATLPNTLRTGMDPNAGSLVVAVLLRTPAADESTGRVAFVATGDATSLTLENINPSITVPRSDEDSDEDEDVEAIPSFENVLHVTAPHHGSFTTSLAAEGRKEKRPRFSLRALKTLLKKRKRDEELDEVAADVLGTFTKALKARTVSASAGIREEWGHPSRKALEPFAQQAVSTELFEDTRVVEGRHFVTAWVEKGSLIDRSVPGHAGVPDKSSYKTFQTGKGVFTTLYVPAHHAARMGISYVHDFATDGDVREQAPTEEVNGPLTVNWIFRAKAGDTAPTVFPEEHPAPAALKAAPGVLTRLVSVGRRAVELVRARRRPSEPSKVRVVG